MRTEKTFLIAVLLIFVSTSLACHHIEQLTSAFADSDGDPGRDAEGLPDVMGRLYLKKCSVCHGKDRAGSSLGSSLVAPTLVYGDSIDQLVASIATGYPDRGMPGWKGTLSDDDIRGLAIYLAEKRGSAVSEALETSKSAPMGN